jgi:hypothetical protein
VARNVEANLVRKFSLLWEGSHAMHVCGDLLRPRDVVPRVKAGHCKGYCGDCAEAALIDVHLEGGPSRGPRALGARADDDQKRGELRQGL